MHDVACVGIIVADNVVRPVDAMPEKGKLALTERISLFTGGCAVNSGIDMAKIGLDVAVIGKVGDDGYGAFVLAQLAKAGVCTKGVAVDDTVSTSASAVLVSGDGERSFLHCIGANGAFREEDVDYSILADSKIVFVAGTFLLPAFDGEGCARMLKKVREMGRLTALDTAWDSRGGWMRTLAPCMPYIDVFMPSYEEAAELSGETEPEKIADVFLKAGVGVCAVKLGSRGCYIKDGKSGFSCTLPTYAGVKRVDANGAGDSFCAGFLTGLAKGWSLRECGRFANAVGTHCIMAEGASSGIRPMEEILSFMKDHPEV